MAKQDQNFKISETNYLNSLNLYIKSCQIFDSNNSLDIAHTKIGNTQYEIARGHTGIINQFHGNPLASQPISVRGGGSFRIHVKYDQKRDFAVIRKFSVCFEELNQLYQIFGFGTLRYDYDYGTAKSNIDNDLHDNPEHPIGHVHLNYISQPQYDFRFPTASLDPRFILVSVSRQYEQLLESSQ